MQLKDWIDKEKDDLQKLPIARTSSWSEFEFISKSRRIDTTENFPPKWEDNSIKSFNGYPREDMIYLFYGLPFYQSKFNLYDKSEYDSRLGNRPIGMLFRNDIIHNNSKFYPFDTGAYFKGLYKEYLQIKPDELHNLKVDNIDGSELCKFVRRYFGTNENYCYGKPIKVEDINGANEDDLISFYDISAGPQKFDQRGKAAEIHLTCPLPVDKNIFLLVLPKYNFKKQENSFKPFIDELKNVPKIFYNDSNSYSPLEDCKKIESEVINYYEKIGLIDYNNIK